MLVLAVELLFMLLFGHALMSFLRRRDPLAGDVTLVFGAMAGFFVLTVFGRLFDEEPRSLSAVAAALLLAQPLMTLRLVSRFRTLPRWLLPLAVLVYAGSTLPVALQESPAATWAVWLAVLAFCATQVVSAVYFVLAAAVRMGAARARLQIAAAGTALFAAALVLAGLDRSTAAQGVALLSAVGYVAAFMPPRRLRRMWAMVAAHPYGRSILSGPAQPSAHEVWRRFAEAVHELSASDAVLVLARTSSGQTTTLATAGLEADAGPIPDPVDFELMNQFARQRRVNRDCPIERSFAVLAGARYATKVPLPPPYTGRAEHVALLLSQHRSLFGDDDLDVVRDLGSQAALLAGRADAAFEQLRLANELSETVEALRVASKAKSDLLARVSHEFRTPLTAIIGYSALLRRGREDGDPTLSTTGPERIHSAGLHLLSMVEEVLDLAQMDAGHLELSPGRIELEDIVAQTVDEVRPLASRKRLTLETETCPGAVSADPQRIRQVLYNLLSNAIKFTPDGGSVKVVTEIGGNEARIAVVDTGIGIPVEDQTRIFEEFTQVGEHGPHEGAGLGLAIASRLVAAHGGRTEVESTPGEGSRFTISLPLATTPAPTRAT